MVAVSDEVVVVGGMGESLQHVGAVTEGVVNASLKLPKPF